MWTTTATLTPNNTSNTWGGYTLRTVIPTSSLAAGYKIRLTLKAPAGNSVVIANAYLQTQAASGDPFDYSATPIQVLFSGLSGTTIAAGATVVTDEIVIPVSGSVSIVFAAYFTTGAAMVTTNAANGAIGWDSYYWNANSTTIVNESGGTAMLGLAVLVTLVEVLT